ncbi:8-oxoguanine glycosylase ogg1 [Savitreella phatthalungensis]
MLKGVLKVSSRELRLDTTLKCGQSFRWIRFEDAEGPGYRCALRGRVISLRQSEDTIRWSQEVGIGDDTEDLLRDYLNLQVDLHSLYKEWSARDAHFSKVSESFLGVRMLRQDPLENLLCFICSSNNNIARITLMVSTLCSRYGTFLGDVAGHSYHDFPSLEQLSTVDTSTLDRELREHGFGYRAKYIAGTVELLASLSPDYLQGLRNESFEVARLALQRFAGVGPKVADCVCLMSLDKHVAVPVDTHVQQIAERDYRWRAKKRDVVDAVEISQDKIDLLGLPPKSKASPAYESCSRFFRDKWGDYAGWAHSVLFTADLRAFRDVKREEDEPPLTTPMTHEIIDESPTKRRRTTVKLEA